MPETLTKFELKVFVHIQAISLVLVSLGCLIHAPLWLHIKTNQFWVFSGLLSMIFVSMLFQIFRCREQKAKWIQQSWVYGLLMIGMIAFIYLNL